MFWLLRHPHESRSSPIIMVEAVENGEGDDGVGATRSGTCPNGNGVVQALMRPGRIEVTAILRQNGK